MKRWNAFMASLAFDKRVDFEEGDIGLAGGLHAGVLRRYFPKQCG